MSQTLVDKLNLTLNTKEDIRRAINEKGVILTDEPFADYADKIRSIPSSAVVDELPIGSIILWFGEESTIPDGWAICDGQDGRPDLRGRFALGVSETHTLGTGGGEEEITLTVSQMPKHKHAINLITSDSSHTGVTGNKKEPYAIGTQLSGSGASPSWLYFEAPYTTYREHVSFEGLNQAHNNMPPYLAVYYIIKVNSLNAQPQTVSAFDELDQQVGTLPDKRPIFEHIIQTTVSITESETIVASMPNIELVAPITGIVDGQNGSEWYGIPGSYSDFQYGLSYVKDTGDIKLYASSTSISEKTLRLFIRYALPAEKDISTLEEP